MGTSVITVRVVGNHGCQRHVGNGGTTQPTCGSVDCAQGCVDAVAKEFVEKLRRTGSVVEANLHHWPDGEKQIVDNLKSGLRTGSF